jgi:hypothetical protein
VDPVAAVAVAAYTPVLLTTASLCYMLGLLANDFVFDTSSFVAGRSYYGTLLASFFDFPQVFRVVVPVLVAGVCVLHGAVRRRCRIPDVFSVLVLMVGSWCFFQTFSQANSLVQIEPSTNDSDDVKNANQERLAALLPYHVLIGFVLVATLVLQLFANFSSQNGAALASRLGKAKIE